MSLIPKGVRGWGRECSKIRENVITSGPVTHSLVEIAIATQLFSS